MHVIAEKKHDALRITEYPPDHRHGSIKHNSQPHCCFGIRCPEGDDLLGGRNPDLRHFDEFLDYVPPTKSVWGAIEELPINIERVKIERYRLAPQEAPQAHIARRQRTILVGKGGCRFPFLDHLHIGWMHAHHREQQRERRMYRHPVPQSGLGGYERSPTSPRGEHTVCFQEIDRLADGDTRHRILLRQLVVRWKALSLSPLSLAHTMAEPLRELRVQRKGVSFGQCAQGRTSDRGFVSPFFRTRGKPSSRGAAWRLAWVGCC